MWRQILSNLVVLSQQEINLVAVLQEFHGVVPAVVKREYLIHPRERTAAEFLFDAIDTIHHASNLKRRRSRLFVRNHCRRRDSIRTADDLDRKSTRLNSSHLG